MWKTIRGVVARLLRAGRGDVGPTATATTPRRPRRQISILGSSTGEPSRVNHRLLLVARSASSSVDLRNADIGQDGCAPSFCSSSGALLSSPLAGRLRTTGANPEPASLRAACPLCATGRAVANTALNEAEAYLLADLGHRKIRLVCSGDVHLLKVSALRSPSLSDPLDSTRSTHQPLHSTADCGSRPRLHRLPNRAGGSQPGPPGERC
jgi:hypothetical protein